MQDKEVTLLHARIVTLEGTIDRLVAQVEAIAKALTVTPLVPRQAKTPITGTTTTTTTHHLPQVPTYQSPEPMTPQPTRPVRHKPPPSPSKAVPSIIRRITKAGAKLSKKAEMELLSALNDYKTSLFHQCQFQIAMTDGEDVDNLESGEASNDGATDNADNISDQEQDQMAIMADHNHVKDADRM